MRRERADGYLVLTEQAQPVPDGGAPAGIVIGVKVPRDQVTGPVDVAGGQRVGDRFVR